MQNSDLFIGLMSGTSLDGIDVALVNCGSGDIKLEATLSYPLPAAFRSDLLALCQLGDDEIRRAGIAHLEMGHLLADAVLALLDTQQLDAGDITAIGSHGQTVRHHPELGFSVQLGSGDVIATRTGIPTVADFRNHDMVLGGQGAPLVPPFHQALFSKSGEKRAIINIGGMANVSLLDGKNLAGGFDTGPGNVLLNSWVSRHLDVPYDDKGKFAASGRCDNALLAALLAAPYFHLTGPKSTGRELFNIDWLDTQLKGTESPADVQATLTAFTASSIANALADFAPDAAYICGGGAHNDFLMQQLAAQLPATQLSTTHTLGWHPDWIEAACFAWLAKQRLARLPSTAPQVTGASRAAISGAVYLP